MPLPLREVVEPVLEPLEDNILGIYAGAWSDWKEDAHCGVFRYKRTRADLVHEHAIRRALEVFSGANDVRPIPGQETCHFLCGDRVMFRLKKGDDDGRTSNIQTELALAYHDPQSTLFELPQVHRVDVAYVLNSLETEIAKILVVGRNGQRILWSYDIMARKGSADLAPPLPMQPTPPRRSLVKLRGPSVIPFPGERKAGDRD